MHETKPKDAIIPMHETKPKNAIIHMDVNAFYHISLSEFYYDYDKFLKIKYEMRKINYMLGHMAGKIKMGYIMIESEYFEYYKHLFLSSNVWLLK